LAGSAVKEAGARFGDTPARSAVRSPDRGGGGGLATKVLSILVSDIR